MVLLILLFCVIFVVFEISKSTRGEDDKDNVYVGDYLKKGWLTRNTAAVSVLNEFK